MLYSPQINASYANCAKQCLSEPGKLETVLPSPSWFGHLTAFSTRDFWKESKLGENPAPEILIKALDTEIEMLSRKKERLTSTFLPKVGDFIDTTNWYKAAQTTAGREGLYKDFRMYEYRGPAGVKFAKDMIERLDFINEVDEALASRQTARQEVVGNENGFIVLKDKHGNPLKDSDGNVVRVNSYQKQYVYAQEAAEQKSNLPLLTQDLKTAETELAQCAHIEDLRSKYSLLGKGMPNDIPGYAEQHRELTALVESLKKEHEAAPHDPIKQALMLKYQIMSLDLEQENLRHVESVIKSELDGRINNAAIKMEAIEPVMAALKKQLETPDILKTNAPEHQVNVQFYLLTAQAFKEAENVRQSYMSAMANGASKEELMLQDIDVVRTTSKAIAMGQICAGICPDQEDLALLNLPSSVRLSILPDTSPRQLKLSNTGQTTPGFESLGSTINASAPNAPSDIQELKLRYLQASNTDTTQTFGLGTGTTLENAIVPNNKSSNTFKVELSGNDDNSKLFIPMRTAAKSPDGKSTETSQNK